MNFDELIKDDLVLVDFRADWCGPCKMLEPVLEQIKNIKIVKIDVDKNRDLCKRYGIMSIPTLLLFKDGELIQQNIGFMDLDTLTEWINK